VVATLRAHQVASLVGALVDTYYVDLDAAREAVARRSMFNVIHLATMLKVDVYVLTDREFDQVSFERRRTSTLEPGSQRTFHVDSPEDTILHKLEWYRAGGEVSERQWGDLFGVLRVQGAALDADYLRRWAQALRIEDLLDRALAEAAGC
jgi:hypothetical protein